MGVFLCPFMKIMIVDDHAEMRRFLRSALDHLATEFVECADGAEAVVAFAEQRPAWTIMDVAMEGMDGLEATRRIRDETPAARILVMTQHDSVLIRRAALEAGAAAYLPKDQLSEIEAVLTRCGSAAAPLD
jgi:two-component system response regulator DesR